MCVARLWVRVTDAITNGFEFIEEEEKREIWKQHIFEWTDESSFRWLRVWMWKTLSQLLPLPPKNYMFYILINTYIMHTHIYTNLENSAEVFSVHLAFLFFFYLPMFSLNVASFPKLQSIWDYIDFCEDANRFANVFSDVMWPRPAWEREAEARLPCVYLLLRTHWGKFIGWIEIKTTYDLHARILNTKLVFYFKLNWWLNLWVCSEFAKQHMDWRLRSGINRETDSGN